MSNIETAKSLIESYEQGILTLDELFNRLVGEANANPFGMGDGEEDISLVLNSEEGTKLEIIAGEDNVIDSILLTPSEYNELKEKGIQEV